MSSVGYKYIAFRFCKGASRGTRDPHENFYINDIDKIGTKGMRQQLRDIPKI